jgi:hypothetical protein
MIRANIINGLRLIGRIDCRGCLQIADPTDRIVHRRSSQALLLAKCIWSNHKTKQSTWK